MRDADVADPAKTLNSPLLDILAKITGQAVRRMEVQLTGERTLNLHFSSDGRLIALDVLRREPNRRASQKELLLMRDADVADPAKTLNTAQSPQSVGVLLEGAWLNKHLHKYIKVRLLGDEAFNRCVLLAHSKTALLVCDSSKTEMLIPRAAIACIVAVRGQEGVSEKGNAGAAESAL